MNSKINSKKRILSHRRLPTMIKNLNIIITISIKEDGSIDTEKQRELAQKYAVIDSIKEKIYKKLYS